MKLLTPQQLAEIRDQHDNETRYRNGKPASMQPHAALCYADTHRQQLLDHIAAMEADKQYSQSLKVKLYLREQTITALEAKLEKFVWGENNPSEYVNELDKAEATIKAERIDADLNFCAMETVAFEALDRIKAISELPDKWLGADKILSCQKGYDDCANALNALLKQERECDK